MAPPPRRPTPSSPRVAPRPVGPRAWTRVATIALVASFAPLAGCSALPYPKDKEVDPETRRRYHEESAQTFYEGGRYEQSTQQWKKVLELAPNDQKAKWGLAKSYAMVGSWPALAAAEAIYVEILPLDWTHPTRGNIKFELERDLAGVYDRKADLLDDYARSMQKRIDSGRKTEEPDLPGKTRDFRAQRDEALRKALPLYESVLRQSPDNPYALAGIAKVNLYTGNEQRGIEYARRYIAISRKSQEGWQREMDDIKVRTKSITTKERDFFLGRMRGAREKEIQMRLLLGSVLIRSRRYLEAAKEYDEILALDPTRAAALVEQAQAYAMAGRYELAVKGIEQYLKITDPVRQQEPRIEAAQLLESYRLELAKRRGAAGSADEPATPPPAPRPYARDPDRDR